MNKDRLQTIVEIERETLINMLTSIGCTNWNAAEFAIEEYFIGEPCGDYDYHNYRKHFTQRFLKRELLDGSSNYRFGTALTDVLNHLFDVQISKAYITIKKEVYQKMDELKENGELWTCDYVADFEEWVGSWSMDFCDGNNEVVDIDWNIKKKKKD